MRFDLFRSLVAPASACLFLILVLWAFLAWQPVSKGFSFPMIRLQHDPNEISCDGRNEFLRLTKDGKTWINREEVPVERIRAEVAAIMENRAERVVYIEVDSELSIDQFAQFVDRVADSTSDLHLVLVSGEVRRALEQHKNDLCDFRYPPKYY
jgi:hypothetical protein